MNNSMKKVLTPGIIIVAFLAAVIVFAMLVYSEKKVLAQKPKKMACSAICDIPEGTIINDENIGQYIENIEVYEELIPGGDSYDLSSFTGRVSRISIPKGSVLSNSMFEAEDERISNLKNPVMACIKADDLYQAVGGILRSGDKIHIYLEMENGDIKLRWKNIYVMDAFDSKGEKVEVSEEGKTSRFNICIEETDVEEFYHMLDSKKVRIVKVCD